MVKHSTILKNKMKLHLTLLEPEWVQPAFWTQKGLIICVCFLHYFIL